MTPSILLIQQKPDSPDSLADRLQEIFDGSARILSATHGLTGLAIYQQHQPAIVVIDEDLQDLSGMSVSTILADMEDKKESLLYLLIRRHLLDHTKADRFFAANTPIDILAAQLQRDLARLTQKPKSESYLNAVQMQRDMLPRKICTKAFRVDPLFSAYDHLSGDTINFWLNDKDQKLYGYLADCEGHDLASYGQVGSTWLSLKRAMWSYQVGIHQSLSDVMSAVNQDYVTLYDRTTIVPSILFCLDYPHGILKYCPAGIPSLLIRRYGQNIYENLPLQSPLLGYEMDSFFEEKEIPIDEIESILFTSDGLSDLLLDEWDGELPIAKHDDVSAIYIHFHQDVHHGHRLEKGNVICNT